MKGWEENAVKYWNTDDYGQCPKCGSHRIKAEKYIGIARDSVSFLCLDCGSSDHFDGVLKKGDAQKTSS